LQERQYHLSWKVREWVIRLDDGTAEAIAVWEKKALWDYGIPENVLTASYETAMARAGNRRDLAVDPTQRERKKFRALLEEAQVPIRVAPLGPRLPRNSGREKALDCRQG